MNCEERLWVQFGSCSAPEEAGRGLFLIFLWGFFLYCMGTYFEQRIGAATSTLGEIVVFLVILWEGRDCRTRPGLSWRIDDACAILINGMPFATKVLCYGYGPPWHVVLTFWTFMGSIFPVQRYILYFLPTPYIDI
jgi:hypothetical protein